MSWRDRETFVASPERRAEGALERVLAAKGAVEALSALIIVLNALQIASLSPEFWAALTRIREVLLLPPDVVRRLYPELYNGSIVAASLLVSAHIALQLAASRAQGTPVAPVMEGVWRVANMVALYSAMTACAIAAAVTKSPLFIAYNVLYPVLAVAALSRDAARRIRRANELAGWRGGRGGGKG
jgi:hypothetical protein